MRNWYKNVAVMAYHLFIFSAELYALVSFLVTVFKNRARKFYERTF